MGFLVFLLIVLGIAYRTATPEERTRVLQIVLHHVRQAKDAAIRGRSNSDPFHDALCARTRWALVTPALVALNVMVFVGMIFGAGALGDPQTLVGWGGNIGPRTTNGEWWRLVTALFVHAGLFHLLVNCVGLVQVGVILERLVGHLAFAAVYVGAGVLASLVSLSAQPMTVSFGASGAVFGIYGLLLASLVWGLLPRSTVTIPLGALKKLAPAAAVFLLYHVAGGGVERTAGFAGLLVGLVCGLVLAIRVSDRKPPVYRIAAATLATVAIAVAFAVPLRGVTDARPEVARVAALEDRMAVEYETLAVRFKRGRTPVDTLTKLIDGTITPELRAARTRLKALAGVPPEQQPLVASADEYLQLRHESWRLRAEGLSGANMRTLQRADLKERESLKALEKIRPVDEKK